MRGLHIAFDGIDGSGKGTLIHILTQVLEDRRIYPVLSKEPGGPGLGEKIRDILFVDPTTKNIHDDAIELLFFANHVHNYHTLVKPALDSGKVVVCDRYWPSAVAYGRERAKNVDPRIQKLYYDVAKENDVCDLLFILTGDPATLLRRAQARTLETHQAGKKWSTVEQLQKIQDVFHEEFPQATFIDTTHDSARKVFQIFVWPKISRLLKERKAA